jgi:ABC-2 type transport system ATP-binding protein
LTTLSPYLLEIHSLTLVDASLDEIGGKTIIDNFNLSLPTGQVCGLIGPNGAGKTAILNALKSNLPGRKLRQTAQDLQKGKIRFREKDTILITDHTSVTDLDQTVIETLQDCIGKDERTTNLGFFDHLVRSLDLQAYQDQKVGSISDGVKRKVEIAVALLSKPKLLLVDEPCKSLDGRSSAVVQALIRQMAREHQTAVLVASRQPEVVRSLCDRVIVIRDGKTLLDSPIESMAETINGEFYRFKLQGEIDASRSTWFGGLVQITGRNVLELTVFIPDQTALHSLLIKIRDLSIPLLSMDRLEPTIEIILNHLMYAPMDDISFQAKQNFLKNIGIPHE